VRENVSFEHFHMSLLCVNMSLLCLHRSLLCAYMSLYTKRLESAGFKAFSCVSIVRSYVSFEHFHTSLLCVNMSLLCLNRFWCVNMSFYAKQLEC